MRPAAYGEDPDQSSPSGVQELSSTVYLVGKPLSRAYECRGEGPQPDGARSCRRQRQEKVGDEQAHDRIRSSKPLTLPTHP